METKITPESVTESGRRQQRKIEELQKSNELFLLEIRDLKNKVEDLQADRAVWQRQAEKAELALSEQALRDKEFRALLDHTEHLSARVNALQAISSNYRTLLERATSCAETE